MNPDFTVTKIHQMLKDPPPIDQALRADLDKYMDYLDLMPPPPKIDPITAADMRDRIFASVGIAPAMLNGPPKIAPKMLEMIQQRTEEIREANAKILKQAFEILAQKIHSQRRGRFVHQHKGKRRRQGLRLS